MRISSLVLCLPIAAVALAAPDARACGGCFAPTSQTSVSTVTGHRMAFAVSPTRTVLWDQFQYDGSPSDFSWVLPILPGAYIEQSNDAWFEALDAVTDTRVTSPQLACLANGSNAGCACGSSSDSGGTAASGKFGGDNVQVVHEGTIGPYDTVTLHSTDPQALHTWLTSNGYAIPTGIDPVINAYVNEGWDFIALRLSPGKGVQEMTPVRVVTPGGEYKLPLRMVAAGVGSFVGITLYVIGSQRYAMPDIAEVSVNDADLSFDFAANTSNYLSLRAKALGQNGGRSFLTSYAEPQAFSRIAQSPGTYGPTSYSVAGASGQSFTTFSDLYFAQADVNDHRPVADCTSVLGSLGASNYVFEDTCTDPGCQTVDGNRISSHAFECNGYDDIAAAMIGMVPNSTWVSRLELNLPSTALDHDCVIAPAVSRKEVSNFRQAVNARNAPCGAPSQSLTARLLGPRHTRDVPGVLMFSTALGMLITRRRRR